MARFSMLALGLMAMLAQFSAARTAPKMSWDLTIDDFSTDKNFLANTTDPEPLQLKFNKDGILTVGTVGSDESCDDSFALGNSTLYVRNPHPSDVESHINFVRITQDGYFERHKYPGETAKWSVTKKTRDNQGVYLAYENSPDFYLCNKENHVGDDYIFPTLPVDSELFECIPTPTQLKPRDLGICPMVVEERSP